MGYRDLSRGVCAYENRWRPPWPRRTRSWLPPPVRSFVDLILSGRQPDMDAEFSRRALPATLVAYQSSDIGRAVDPSSLT
jgi:hypothetical protein